ncbi:MAG TPA: hypothetical protein VEX68_28700 [Bryobacteraceae bacterium]|nr:hypothetical protein [Bryobacteraceae bacterium]
MKKHLPALMFSLVLGSVVQAESIRHEHRQQMGRIHQGIRSGELTRSEASRLYQREAALRWQTVRDRRDGSGLTSSERNRIQTQQNRLSRSIYRQKHDGQDR